MWIKSAPPHPMPIDRRVTASVMYAGIALIIVPLLAVATSGIPALTKLGHQIAFFLGVVMVVYGAAAVSYARAAGDASIRHIEGHNAS